MEKKRIVKCKYCGEHFISESDKDFCPYCNGVSDREQYSSAADADFVCDGNELIEYIGNATHVIICLLYTSPSPRD